MQIILPHYLSGSERAGQLSKWEDVRNHRLPIDTTGGHLLYDRRKEMRKAA
ncbi:MAG: hypothetical protein GY801_15195 [bacterium]|nr:hypothetical protein [bacterium]